MKKNILVISSHMPSLKIPQAGQKIALSFFQGLSKTHNVYLIAFRNNFEKMHSSTNELEFCKEVHLIEQSLLGKIVNILLHPFLPLRVATRKNKAVENLIKNYINLLQIDKVHFEFTSSMLYADLFDYKNVFLQTTAHDVTFQSYYRKYQQSSGLKRFMYKIEYLRFKKWEISVLNKMSSVIVLNTKDLDILQKENISLTKIKVNPPIVDMLFLSARQDQREMESLLFWGAMNRMENEDAILWFLEKIYPTLKQSRPNIKLYIVGNSPSGKVQKFRSENIIVTGFVDSPIKYFEKATLAIAPLRLGAGVKIKVLESLAAGLKVISTEVGAEGIENSNLIIANDENSFILKILENL